MLESVTALRMPTSPFACVFSNPPVQVHTGGQLGTPRCDISEWSRSNIGVDLRRLCSALGPLRSTSPISWSVLPQCRRSTAYISRQKAASLIERSPMYSAPACSIIRKQRVDGLTGDTKTFFRMPTSPRGWVLSKPPQYNQTGGQLRLFWYVISGWSRSNMIASSKMLSARVPNLKHQFRSILDNFENK